MRVAINSCNTSWRRLVPGEALDFREMSVFRPRKPPFAMIAAKRFAPPVFPSFASRLPLFFPSNERLRRWRRPTGERLARRPPALSGERLCRRLCRDLSFFSLASLALSVRSLRASFSTCFFTDFAKEAENFSKTVKRFSTSHVGSSPKCSLNLAHAVTADLSSPDN